MRIGVLPGEGISPSIIAATLDALQVIESAGRVRFDIRHGGRIGKDAVRESGRALTPEVEAFCEETFAAHGAVICGAGGARFVYELRRRFDLYCKLVPLAPLPALADAGVLRPELLGEVDIVVVRENVGGLYFGVSELSGPAGERVARLAAEYRESDILRIIRVAANLAALRKGRLCVIVKPGAMGSFSELWEQCARHTAIAAGVELRCLEVDNACYQLIADPRQFDVVVAPNMFGDVLADGAAVLLASRGMSHSANFGAGHRAVYQTGHGAAYDLAGRDGANPLGQMLSAAMMLRESFGLAEEAASLERAIASVLAAGWRTRDIMAGGCREVGTRRMGELVCAALAGYLA